MKSAERVMFMRALFLSLHFCSLLVCVSSNRQGLRKSGRDGGDGGETTDDVLLQSQPQQTLHRNDVTTPRRRNLNVIYGGPNIGDEASYVPGNLNIEDTKNGIMLSQGLHVRTIGNSGRRVRYANGRRSSVTMHLFPDAAGCFDMPDGYIYVSNSEVPLGRFTGAGVGSFSFDRNGNLRKYERVLDQKTAMNCGGGKTPWGTWLTGEEHGSGEVWEVDPLGKRPANITEFGRADHKQTDGKRGRDFESAICDDRGLSVMNAGTTNATPTLQCFATIDDRYGELRRFRPTTQVLAKAVETGDYSQVLQDSNGIIDYLVLDVPFEGMFIWTDNITLAQENANVLYTSLEGIDHYDGSLYLASKTLRDLIVLDLDKGNYTRSTTEYGAFDNQPDQVAHLLGDDGLTSMLYFVEDGGEAPGLFARYASNDGYYPIIEKIPQVFLEDEVTGMAFCDGNKRLMFGLQRFNYLGRVLEVTRKDGLPFTGSYINIKTHVVDTE